MHTCEPALLRSAAPAKINLFLEVLGRRADGYHELVTCMALLDWADELTFMPADQLYLNCDDSSLPRDANNLVMRAAIALKNQTQTKHGAAISLTKRIPSPAGLGGGSSDAAATLRGLNQLWNTGLSDSQMMALAAQIGSDVPFFLAGSAAWCRGRGEQVTPFKIGISIPILVVCPLVGLGTAAVYQSLQAPPLDVGKSQARSESSMIEALRTSSLEAIGAQLFNRLQSPAERCLPLIGELRQLFENAARQGLCCSSLMSGSGSSYFAVCRSRQETQQLARHVQQLWDGGVRLHGMGTDEPRDGPPERTLRLYITEAFL